MITNFSEYLKENIDDNVLSNLIVELNVDVKKYFRKGKYGKIYELTDGRLLKITKSKVEYDTISKIINHKSKNIVEYYAAGAIYDDLFYIIMEKVTPNDEKIGIVTLENILEKNDIPLFSDGGYTTKENYEMAVEYLIKNENKKYLDLLTDIYEIAKDLEKYNIYNGDYKDENIGYKNNKLVVFDIMNTNSKYYKKH